MWTRIRLSGVAVVLLTLACGGPKHKVDEAILRDIPLQEKQGMRNAKADMDRAAEERELAWPGSRPPSRM